jgi:drug/metabolite transporter (DMT)-like permease
MFELWIPITIFAAFMQNARSALQKHLKGRLTSLGAAYVRFLYAWPFALIYLAILYWGFGWELPRFHGTFLAWSILGGLSQILFTVLLMVLFNFRNFAVGTTFSKTEVAQVAIFGLILLGDKITLTASIAIAISVAGVLIMSAGQTKVTLSSLFTSLGEKATLLGLTCGAFLGLSVVFFRAAALSLEHGNFIMAACYTLAISVVLQTLMMGAYLLWKERQTLTDVLVCWRPASMVGLAGMLGSVGWFTAFTLQNAAYVRALGQIELLFTFLVTVFFFREKTTKLEVVGIILVVIGIVLLLLWR